MRIKTNDPNRPWLQVAVTGMVEKFAEISPDRVLLKGKANDIVFTDVVIVPRKEYPFTIESLKARKGKFIQYELMENQNDDAHRYVVRIKNTRTQKGRFADVLELTTDSKIRPHIPIYIVGLIE